MEATLDRNSMLYWWPLVKDPNISGHVLDREAIYLSGIWLTWELAEVLIMLTREAQEHYDRHTDEEILMALDFISLEPEIAVQFLEECAA